MADTLATFPPLLNGRPTQSGVNPFDKAVAAAAAGRTEAGDVWWSDDAETLRAAVVFEPDCQLKDAMAMVFAAGCAMNDALGVLTPPETGVAHVWPDGVKVNGAWCGALTAAADVEEPDDEPGWLVVGAALSLRADEIDPGENPDVTALSEEGCGDISHIELIESWSRHLLVWINTWEDDGFKPLHDAWLNRAEGRGDSVAFAHDGRLERGVFLGLDEHGGMLLKTEDGTRTIPLAGMLTKHRPWPPEKIE